MYRVDIQGYLIEKGSCGRTLNGRTLDGCRKIEVCAMSEDEIIMITSSEKAKENFQVSPFVGSVSA